MNQQTLELLRRLQSSERDAQAFESIRSALASQRSHLVSEDDRATLADLSELLEVWAETATPDLAAAATASAAQIADEDLEQAERAVQLYVLSLEREPGASEPLERLDALLCRRGERDRLESILGVHAKTLRERAEVDPERAGAVLRRLGQLRADSGGDVNPAIEAYEQALDLAADPDTIRALADLYVKRGAPGDNVQAADLYCTLGDVMGAPDGAAMLERALDQAPGHDAALDLLESYVPVADQPTRLKQRWSAYIERSNDEGGVDKRRLLLARAHAAEGQHREALICIGPLSDKGDPEALRLQAAFLANLHEAQEKPAPAAADSQAGAAAKSGNGKSVKRPATLVGFRLPPGDGVPAVAEPPPEGTLAEASESAEDDAEPTGTAAQDAASARNAPAARSGETLVGFRMPIGKTSVTSDPSGENTPVVLPAPTAGAARSDQDEGERGRNDRGSGERGREDRGSGERVRGSGELAGAAAAPTARASATSSAGDARARSSGTAAAAAARASGGGPAALSAALGATRSSSPGTQPAASAQRASSPGRISAPEVESPAAKAAALKASRSSSPPPASIGGSPAARRVSAPPPLKRRMAGASPAAAAASAAVASEQPRAFGGPAALAATMPMPVVAPLPTPVAAPAAFAPAEALPASAPQATAPAVLPRSKPLDGELDAFAARKRKIDPRWLAAGGVAAAAVIVGVIWTSGGDDPPASDASRAEAAPSAATAPPAAPTPVPVAAPSATPAPAAAAAAPAPATPPSNSATAMLAAAVATNSAPAPAAPPSKRARDPEVEVGQVKVRGGLGAKAVSSAIDDGLSKIESCYADAVERKPNLEGKLTFSFNIDKSGKATRVRKQSGTLKDAALQRCSTEAIEKIRFPKAKKRSAQVTLPLAYNK